jgi:hypothetical protein
MAIAAEFSHVLLLQFAQMSSTFVDCDCECLLENKMIKNGKTKGSIMFGGRGGNGGQRKIKSDFLVFCSL